MNDRALRIAKSLQAVGLAVFIYLAVSPGESFSQDTAALQHASAPPSSTAIPPAEVANRSSGVTNLLVTFSQKLALSPEIDRIKESLPEVSRQIELDLFNTATALAGKPPLAILETQRSQWQRRHLQVSTWLTLLTQRAGDLQKTLGRLSQMKQIWSQTREAAYTEQTPEAILQQVATTLAAIEAAQLPLRAQEEAALGLQADLVKQRARCDEMLAQILKIRNSVFKGILARESLPIWRPDLWEHTRTALPHRLRGITRALRASLREYAHDPSRGMPLHLALFIVLVTATCAARRKKRLWTAGGADVLPALEVFDTPYSAALIIVLLFATAVISPAPVPVKNLLSALELAPMIRLVRPAIDPFLAPGVFTAVILYAVDFARQLFGGVLLVEQALLILESLAAIAALGWLRYAENLRSTPEQVPDGFRARCLPLLAKVLMFCLGGGCLSAAFGFTGLARLITPAIVYGGVLALTLYAYIRVSTGVLAILLRLWPLQRLRMVRNHGDRVEAWIYRLLVWTAVFFWAIRLLAYIGMLDSVLSAGSLILGLKLERGSISISIADILALGLTVLAAYLLSAFIRFALQEEVYPRRGVTRGLAYAYSRLVHYVILTIGFLVGLGVLGMDLTKVSVLAGAFGVGIGFGLQNVVNNFVCGLILLFERPVHVGDIVEVGDLQGEVRKIGIRASTVRILQGADIIVPNAQFITANVTNWTYSDQLRRIDLPVGVSYSAEPQKVIEIIKDVAAANPRVLKHPPPQAVFTAFGESSINFELRAWTDQSADWYKIRSELAVAVYDAVRSAGMSFPFPQREVRLLNDEKA